MEEFYQNNHFAIFSQPALTIKSVVMYNGTCCNLQNIEYMVELEMARIKHNWLQSEQEYVERLLLENPISMERRPTISGDEVIDVVSVTTESENDRKQQRADACRRSRYNNKIRKAKSKYRRMHMMQKLESSIELLDNIENVVAHTESRLLSRGFSKDTLQHLRMGFRLDAVSSSQT